MSSANYKAIIFDCDGVLVDSEPHSCYAWNILFERKFGISIGKDYTPVLGKSGIDAARHYCKTHHISYTLQDLHQLSEEKEQIYYELAQGSLQPQPGIKILLSKVLKLKFKIAVASSGTIEKIHFNLHTTGLEPFFSIIIDASQVTQGKPEPEIFLKAASALKIPISNCIVIEDSLSGIKAAKRSGAFTIALAGTFPVEKLKEADMVILGFSELNLQDLRKKES